MRRGPSHPLAFGGDGQAYTAAELYEVGTVMLHPNSPRRADQWAVFRELRFGTGYSPGADSTIDAFALNCWPSSRFTRHAYEIKVSRGDFLRELRQPQKRRPGLLISTHFWFLCPPGVAKPEEIPVDCGLVVARRTVDTRGRRGWSVRQEVPAPPRDEMGVSWAFVASLARRVVKTEEANGHLR